ncbi:unnamed protein product [Parnassius apollo]|uniref:(apollo) hypothetical protein n=1 Tax=Parnassius apollo TaxID=110799 RepID=A0A8S3X6V9_PARAO|nr:unnamed protein product [Parnassius apollo]
MNEDGIESRPIRKKVAAQRSRGTFKTSGNNIFKAKGIVDDMQGFQKDLMLNLLANRRARNRDLASGSSSSSLEMQHWKDEWRNIWIQKKLEAVNASPPAGDTVNMVAARKILYLLNITHTLS